MPDLHRRAARWYQVNGLLLDAVRQAVAADDWPLAAQLVLDELAIGQLSEPHDPLADCFRRMPYNPTWTGPQPALIAAALALADLAPVAACAALDVAEEILGRLPADTETPARLAAAMLRLTVARRAGDLGAAAAAMDQVESWSPAARRHPDQARRDPHDGAVSSRGGAVLVGTPRRGRREPRCGGSRGHCHREHV